MSKSINYIFILTGAILIIISATGLTDFFHSLKGGINGGASLVLIQKNIIPFMIINIITILGLGFYISTLKRFNASLRFFLSLAVFVPMIVLVTLLIIFLSQ